MGHTNKHGSCLYRSHIQRGFSLVELLVVIAIVGVLMAVLLPSLSHARGVALETKCQAQLRQVGIGVLTYANDFSDAVPPHYNHIPGTGLMYQGTKAPDDMWAYHATSTLANGPYKLRAGLTYPDYVTDSRAFYCPDSRNTNNGRTLNYNMTFGNSPTGTYTGFRWLGVRNDYSGQFIVSYAFPAVNTGPITRTNYGGNSNNTPPNYWNSTNYWQQVSIWGASMVQKRVTDNAGSTSNPMVWDNNTDGSNMASHDRRVTVVTYFDGSGLKYPNAQHIFMTKSHSTYGARGFQNPQVLTWFRAFKVNGTLQP